MDRSRRDSQRRSHSRSRPSEIRASRSPNSRRESRHRDRERESRHSRERQSRSASRQEDRRSRGSVARRSRSPVRHHDEERRNRSPVRHHDEERRNRSPVRHHDEERRIRSEVVRPPTLTPRAAATALPTPSPPVLRPQYDLVHADEQLAGGGDEEEDSDGFPLEDRTSRKMEVQAGWDVASRYVDPIMLVNAEPSSTPTFTRTGRDTGPSPPPRFLDIDWQRLFTMFSASLKNRKIGDFILPHTAAAVPFPCLDPRQDFTSFSPESVPELLVSQPQPLTYPVQDFRRLERLASNMLSTVNFTSISVRALSEMTDSQHTGPDVSEALLQDMHNCVAGLNVAAESMMTFSAYMVANLRLTRRAAQLQASSLPDDIRHRAWSSSISAGDLYGPEARQAVEEFRRALPQQLVETFKTPAPRRQQQRPQQRPQQQQQRAGQRQSRPAPRGRGRGRGRTAATTARTASTQAAGKRP